MSQRQLLIFSGRSNEPFSRTVCDTLKVSPGKLDVIQFLDGEISVDVQENVRGRDVFIIQSTSTPVNERLVELLVLIDAFKRASAWRITAVMPYFGYARQDRKLKPRVPISAKLVADVLTVAGAKRVLTMDLHAGQIMGFFDVPVDNLNAFPVLIPEIRKRFSDLKDLVIVSPDVGGVERTRHCANRLDNSSMAIIDKRRSGPNEVSEMSVIGNVEGKTCVIVDDMIDTGGTLVKAAEALQKAGAKKIIACGIHAVFSGNAVERIGQSSIDEVIITDTIFRDSNLQLEKIKTVSVAPLFAEAIRRIHLEDSVSDLFK